MVAPRTKSSSTILLSSLVFITACLCSIQFLIPVEKEASAAALKVLKQEFLQNKKTALGSSAASTVKTATPLASSNNNSSNHANNTEIRRPNDTRMAKNSKNGSSENKKDTTPKYHVVFSTSCTDQQHWESMVFFYHAYKIQQPGSVTRIVSGCNDKETKEQDDFFAKYIQPMRPNGDFHLHHTPDYSRIKLAEGQAYKYMNKPYGLRHWMEHGLGLSTVKDENKTTNRPVEDDIVILMDPDMILLRPLTHDFSDVENHIWLEDNPGTRVVRHGFPMAQQDGYLGNEWMNFDVAHITNQTKVEYVPIPSGNDGPIHWNTGPPYLATVRDMYKIAVRWTEYVIRVIDIYPQLFGEMYGMIHSTVQLKLPFTLLKSIVVSTTTTGNREGWAFVDALPDDQVCSPPDSAKLPIVLHYCERYLFGRMFFSKYRIKKNIMNCEKPLLLPPPDNLTGSSYNYSITPPRADLKDKDTYKEDHRPLERGALQGKREYFMLCGLTRALNQALMHHKEMACPRGGGAGGGDGPPTNLNRTYTVYDDPSNY